ncbi:MAG TPA: hypothetical protein DCG24_00305, partial [Bacteroidetes bacterium]|nr:hypothetical protein [Bacteroidota bacterium]
MKWYTKILSLPLLLLPLTLSAQDKLSLQKKYDQLQSEIKDAQDLLSQTREKKNNSLSQVKLLNRKINVREEMIRNLSMQVQQTAIQIRESSEKITAMEANLESMREDYARMVYYAYVNDKEYEPIHFLFASGSINDAYTEIEYVREYT